MGVLQGRIVIDDDADRYRTLDDLEGFRREVATATEGYLRALPEEEVSVPRALRMWNDREVMASPANVILRTQTHLHQHQGQVVAMCRQMGKRLGALDYPIT